MVLRLFLITLQVDQCSVTLGKSLNFLGFNYVSLGRIWLTIFFCYRYTFVFPHTAVSSLSLNGSCDGGVTPTLKSNLLTPSFT